MPTTQIGTHERDRITIEYQHAGLRVGDRLAVLKYWAMALRLTMRALFLLVRPRIIFP